MKSKKKKKKKKKNITSSYTMSCYSVTVMWRKYSIYLLDLAHDEGLQLGTSGVIVLHHVLSSFAFLVMNVFHVLHVDPEKYENDVNYEDYHTT